MCVFLTSNFRSVRNLAMMSLLHHTNVSVGAMSVGRAGRVRASRNVAVLASTAFTRASFTSTSVLILPKKVPKAGCLTKCGPLASLLASFGDGNGGVTTVYTTPDMFSNLKFLGGHGTASCPSFVRVVTKSNTGADRSGIMMSKGVAADHNLKATMSFTLSLVSRLRGSRGTGRVTRSMMCAHWVILGPLFLYRGALTLLSFLYCATAVAMGVWLDCERISHFYGDKDKT